MDERPMQHQNSDIKQALVRLTDALCSWERSTGIDSVLILREKGGFVYRAVSGKANIPDDIPDSHLMKIIESNLTIKE